MRNKRLVAALLSAMLAVSSVLSMSTANTVFAAEAAEIMETEETDTAAEEETAIEASADEEKTGEEESALIEEETDNGEETAADPDEKDADAGLSGEEADAAGEEADAVGEEADSAEEDAGLAGEEDLAEEAEADAEATEGATEEAAAPEEEADPAVIEEEAPAEEITKPEKREVIVENAFGEQQASVDSDLPSSDDMFAAYVDREFGIADEGKFRKSNMGAKLTGIDKVTYDYISGELVKIEQGDRSSAIFEIPVAELGIQVVWTAEELGVDSIFTDDGVNQAAVTALINQVQYNPVSIVGSLLADNPYLLYWFDKTEGYLYGGGMGWRAYDHGDGEKIELTGVHRFKFTVARAYALGEFEVDTSIGATVRAAAANARGVVSRYSSYSDYDKLHNYMDAICDMVDYNHPAADDDNTPYGDPWQMIWVFDDDPATKVVCEGYSKAFQYLCDESDFNGDITCYSVTGLLGAGTGAGKHMWNIVTMENGLNYLVDVTNSDEGSVGQGDWLFLAGTNGSVEEGYTFDADGDDVPFTYDDKTIGLYPSSILELADTYYRPAPTIEIEDGDVSLSETEFTYDGTGKQPEVKVVHDGTVLTQGTDFKVEYSNNINAGEAVAIVRGIGGYSGTVEKPFTIKKAPQILMVDPTELTTDPYNYTEVAVIGADGAISVSSDHSEVATAAFDTDLEPVTHYSGDAASSGLPYKLAMVNPIEIGNALITFTAAGDENHEEGVARLLVTVVKGDLTNRERCEIRIEPDSFVYTGSQCQPVVSVIYNRQPLRMEWDYNFYYENNVEPGEGQVVITGCGMFTGEVRVPFIINEPAPIDISNNSSISFRKDPEYDLVYNGQPKTPKIFMYYEDELQEEEVDYTYTFSNNVNAGRAYVTVRGIGRFTGRKQLYFEITKAQQRLTVDPAELSVDPWNITQVAVIGGKTQVTATSSNNGVASVNIGGSVQPVTPYHGEALGGEEPYVLATIVPKKEGTARITFTARGTQNYEVASVTLQVTVTKGDISKDWCRTELSETEYVYTGEEHKPGVLVRYYNQTLTEGTDYEVHYESNVNAGTGLAIVTGIGSFTGERVMEFTIKKAQQRLTVDPDELTVDPWNITDVKVSGANTRISVTSDHPEVATASMETDVVPVTPYSGNVVDGVLATIFPQAEGKALIKFTAEGDENHEEGSVSLLVTVVKGDLTRDRCEVTVTPTSFEYTGQACYPSVSVTYCGHPLRMEWDYDFYYENEVGPGEAYVVITGVGSFTGERRVPYTISDRVEQEIDCDTSSPVVNQKTLNYTVTGAQGELTFAIADTSVATVASVNGAEVTVKGLKPGITKLIVTAAETDGFYAAEEEFEIRVVPGATSRVRATNLADCMKITWEKVEGATKYDVYRDGEYMLSTSNLYCPDKDARYKNLQKFTYKVVACTTVNKVKLESTEARTTTYYRVMTVGVNTLSNTQAGKLKVTYTTNPASTGYVVRYGQNADLSDGKTKTIFGAGTNSYTITGVKKGTTYYVQVRTFVRKPVEGGGTFDYFSTYSTIKHIKITK